MLLWLVRKWKEASQFITMSSPTTADHSHSRISGCTLSSIAIERRAINLRSFVFPAMASGKDIEDLPDELLLEIFSYFGIEELAMRVQHVSTRWREVSLDNSLWKCKTYSPNCKVTDEEIVQHLQNMPALRAFAQTRRSSTRMVDALCSTCKNVERLEFHCAERHQILCIVERMAKTYSNLLTLNITLPLQVDQLRFAELIGQFKKLTTLNFPEQYIGITKCVLSVIADGCPNLVHVDLGYCAFDDEDIRMFLQKKKHNLLSIYINCYTSTLTYVALTKCVKLEKLWYDYYNDDLPSGYVENLSNLSKLRELSILYLKGAQTGNLHKIFMNKSLPLLSKLRIQYCENLDSQMLQKVLKNCSHLKSFAIVDSDVETGLEALRGCSELEELTIKCISVKDETMKHVGSSCHKIKSLDLSFCQSLTEKAVEYICTGCSQLEHLILRDLRELTDDVFESICKCKKMKSLTMERHPRITGSSFHLISEHLVHLTEFNIYWCEALSKENLERLKTEMPHIKIHYIGYNSENETNTDIELDDAEFFISTLF